MSLRFSFREMKLAAGKKKRVDEIASFFMMVSNTGGKDVKISIDDSTFSDCPVGYDYMERKEDEFFEHIDFMNPNASEITIEYILSTGLIKSSPTIVALVEILAELTGLSTGEIWGTEKNIGVSQSQVMAANASRHSGSCQAKSTNTGIIYIGYDDTVATTKWIAELQPGQSHSFDDWLGTIHAIATAADQKLGYGEHQMIFISAPVRKLGARVVKVIGTSYLAESDGEANGVYTDGGSDSQMQGFTDGSNPPTTRVDAASGSATGALRHNGVSFSVQKGNYWKVSHSGLGSPIVYWIPEAQVRYSTDQVNLMDHRKNLIFGLESNTGFKSKFRSLFELSSYE